MQITPATNYLIYYQFHFFVSYYYAELNCAVCFGNYVDLKGILFHFIYILLTVSAIDFNVRASC